MDEGIHKMWSIQTVDYHSASKWKKILTGDPTRTNLEDIILSEISWPQKGKYCTVPLCMSPLEKANSQRQKAEGGCQGLV